MINKKLLNNIIEEIARERFLSIEEVEKILNEVIIDFIRLEHSLFDYLKCEILESGEIKAFVERLVIEDCEECEDLNCIIYSKAIKKKPGIEIGEYLSEQINLDIEPADIKQILYNLKQKLKVLQKEKEFQFFESKLHQNVTGYVKKHNNNDYIISFPEGEGILKKNKILPNDIIKSNTYIKLYVEDVRQGDNNQVFFSRIHPNFVKELLINEIPEINEHLIEIKSIARDHGSKTKIAVHSNTSYLNAKKCCIGENGNKIKNVIKEISGEKIDIILWDQEITQFIVNAFFPYNIIEIIKKKEGDFIVIIDEEDFKKAMGRNGQNVKLVKRLCNLKKLQLMTEREKVEKYKAHVDVLLNNLIKQLEIEEMMAHLLINEGLDSPAVICATSIDIISKLDGFNEEIAEILIDRAKEYIENEKNDFKKELLEAKLDVSLFEVSCLSVFKIKHLIENNINSKTLLSFLDAEEVQELFENTEEFITSEEAEIIIRQSRNISK